MVLLRPDLPGELMLGVLDDADCEDCESFVRISCIAFWDEDGMLVKEA